MTMRRFFALCLALAMLALLAGCATDPARSDDAYQAAFDYYMKALAEGDYAALYAMLTPESRSATPEDTFLKRHTSIYGDIGASALTVQAKGLSPLDVQGGSDRLGGRRVAFHMSLNTIAGPIEFDNTADLYAYRGEGETVFRLEWGPQLIFPALTADRPVRIDTQKAKRGSIYDANGVLLAGDGVIKSVGLVPGKMSEDRDADIARIADILGMTVEEIGEKLSAAWVKDDIFVPLAELAEEDVEAKEQLLTIPGIRIDDKKGRVYPYGKEVAREEEYMDTLRGVDGCRIAITDARGEVVEVLAEKPVKNGEDVHLEIDVRANQ